MRQLKFRNASIIFSGYMNYIELFAGCGGLSLGLKSVGFKLEMANELSPMASESYAFNFFGEDLQAQALKEDPKLTKTLWLNSSYGVKQLQHRLREDPRTFPKIGDGHCDIAENGANLNGSLVVGSIVELNQWLVRHPKVASQLKSGFGKGGVDLVSGGPPCQSFSMAGLRQKDSDKNTLPWEFAKFVKTVEPKIVLLENVTGILRPFLDKEGNRFYAWFELAKAFAEIGYVPLCLHVNAKVSGVPQNRPRFILFGVKKSFYQALLPTFNESEADLFRQPYLFFKRVTSGMEPALGELDYRDVARPRDMKLFEDSFLRALIQRKQNYVSVCDAIDDLRGPESQGSPYAALLSRTFAKVIPKRVMANHEFRVNNDRVRRRFRLYQMLSLVGNEVRRNVQAVLKGDSHDLSEKDWKEVSEFKFLLESDKLAKFKTKEQFLEFLGRHPTKKQTQKALLAGQPAPAALSIPDDACHYHDDEQRTLTVREMARIQSFPDSFVFRSKVTTGGKMRSFEAPQYTQVGNAVPPLLGRALGLAAADLLSRNVKMGKSTAKPAKPPAAT